MVNGWPLSSRHVTKLRDGRPMRDQVLVDLPPVAILPEFRRIVEGDTLGANRIDVHGTRLDLPQVIVVRCQLIST